MDRSGLTDQGESTTYFLSPSIRFPVSRSSCTDRAISYGSAPYRLYSKDPNYEAHWSVWFLQGPTTLLVAVPPSNIPNYNYFNSNNTWQHQVSTIPTNHSCGYQITKKKLDGKLISSTWYSSTWRWELHILFVSEYSTFFSHSNYFEDESYNHWNTPLEIEIIYIHTFSNMFLKSRKNVLKPGWQVRRKKNKIRWTKYHCLEFL